TQGCLRRVEERVDLVLTGDVGGAGEDRRRWMRGPQLLAKGVELDRGARAQRHRRAFGDEALGDGGAGSLARAGDDRATACELHGAAPIEMTSRRASRATAAGRNRPGSIMRRPAMVKAKSSAERSRNCGHSVASTAAAAPSKAARASGAIVSVSP